jgi:hypothetical protein
MLVPMSKDDAEDADIAKRRDAVLRHMLSRPPQPHKPLGASKRKARPTSKGRVRKETTRS